MTFIYQIYRALLQEAIGRQGHYIRGRVLDAGSGSYSRYKHLFVPDSVVRMDIIEGPNVDVVGRAERMPFRDAEFDSILSTQVFEHLEYPEKAAAEFLRVLKIGGYVLLSVPQWNELHEEPHDYWRYTRYGIQSLFERNGFRTVTYEQCGGFFSTKAQMTMRYFIDRFRLYYNPMNRLVSFIFKIWGKFAIWLDKVDNHKANRKHAIGWVFVFKKES